MDLIVTLSINDTQHKDTQLTHWGVMLSDAFSYCYTERNYAECRCAECRGTKDTCDSLIVLKNLIN
jgi:hypothetical protein